MLLAFAWPGSSLQVPASARASAHSRRRTRAHPSRRDQAVRWHLSHAVVLHPSSGRCWLFPCHAWLRGSDSTSGSAGARCCVELAPSDGSGLQQDADEPWLLEVTTGGQPGAAAAGTAAAEAPRPCCAHSVLRRRGDGSGWAWSGLVWWGDVRRPLWGREGSVWCVCECVGGV